MKKSEEACGCLGREWDSILSTVMRSLDYLDTVSAEDAAVLGEAGCLTTPKREDESDSDPFWEEKAREWLRAWLEWMQFEKSQVE